MDSTVERWQQSGLYDKLQRHGGSIIVEPRSDTGKNAKNKKNNFSKNSSTSSSSRTQDSFGSSSKEVKKGKSLGLDDDDDVSTPNEEEVMKTIVKTNSNSIRR